ECRFHPRTRPHLATLSDRREKETPPQSDYSRVHVIGAAAEVRRPRRLDPPLTEPDIQVTPDPRPRPQAGEGNATPPRSPSAVAACLNLRPVGCRARVGCSPRSFLRRRRLLEPPPRETPHPAGVLAPVLPSPSPPA